VTPIAISPRNRSRPTRQGARQDPLLCPPWFADSDPEGRARTIVHECTHKYAGTDDNAYHWDPKFATLKPKDALDNADSYAWFCIDVR
jgi:hypothetical protein